MPARCHLPFAPLFYARRCRSFLSLGCGVGSSVFFRAPEIDRSIRARRLVREECGLLDLVLVVGRQGGRFSFDGSSWFLFRGRRFPDWLRRGVGLIFCWTISPGDLLDGFFPWWRVGFRLAFSSDVDESALRFHLGFGNTVVSFSFSHRSRSHRSGWVGFRSFSCSLSFSWPYVLTCPCALRVSRLEIPPSSTTCTCSWDRQRVRS